MADRPEPLSPPECDLRSFPYMGLDVVRLRDSDTAAIEDAEAFRAAVLLWCASWHQLPAASLPDDDAALCRLAGYGRDMKTWKRVKTTGALRGWILCSDGRLYHPVVAEKAREAWDKKESQRQRTEAARLAREEARRQEADKKSNNGSGGNVTSSVTEIAAKPVLEPVTVSVTENVAESKGEERRGEEKKEKKEPPPSLRSGSPPRGQTRENRGCRLDPNWQPTPGNRDFARKLGLDPDDVAAEFRGYWCALPGPKARKLDWPATFDNRCREVAGRRKNYAGSARNDGKIAMPIGLFHPQADPFEGVTIEHGVPTH